MFLQEQRRHYSHAEAAGREREILRGERRADIYRRYVLKFEHTFVALTKYLPFGKANGVLTSIYATLLKNPLK